MTRLHILPVLLVTLMSLAAIPEARGQAMKPVTAATTPTVLDQPELVKEYQATITADELAAHLYLFASDLFEGRETATRGQKLAAYYLASQYRRLGIAPKGTALAGENVLDAYLQPFPVYARRLESADLVAQAGGKELATSRFGKDAQDGQSYLAFGNQTNVTGDLVFAGYGIADSEFGYNDYDAMKEAGIDHTTGWIMILRDEPLLEAEKSHFPTTDGKPSKWTEQPMLKFNTMFQRGLPKGILIVGDSSPAEDKSVAELAAKRAAELGGVGNLSLTEDASGRQFPPFYVISTELANKILAPSGRTVADVQSEIDGGLKPIVFHVPDVTVSSTLTHGSGELQTENVAAYIEGVDPALKDEFVVISSHYDHIGLEAEGDDLVNNGADDDGSGTVTILEIAEAFAAAKADGKGPRRSILFLNFSGEEKGLLGSAYYSDTEPLVSLEMTVTNLNIDMIGRIDPTHPGDSDHYVYIIGSKLISQELHDLNAEVNKLTGTHLDLNERFNSREDPNRFYARSDHWNFGKHGIPFIFYFTGTHEDYHQPGDEPHKIEYERMADIGRLIFATAWQVANQDRPPAVSGTGFN